MTISLSPFPNIPKYSFVDYDSAVSAFVHHPHYSRPVSGTLTIMPIANVLNEKEYLKFMLTDHGHEPFCFRQVKSTNKTMFGIPSFETI